MKGKTRVEKGITLIALIITIVILLILAAVAISSITNDGILSYATNAAKDYNQAVKNEQAMLDYYESYLSGTAGKWVQNGTKVSKTTPEGTTTLTVGDYVNYISGVSGYTDANGWQVLGAENGQILLISSSYVVSEHYLEGADGYLNGVAELNDLCVPYGKGEYADLEKTRSVNRDDINRVTGYDPVTANYASEQVGKYGNKVTYTLVDGNVAYNGVLSNKRSFIMPDGKVLGKDVDSVTLTSTRYSYTAVSYLTDTNSSSYKMLFGTDDMKYWLASVRVYPYAGMADFGINQVDGGKVTDDDLWYTNGGAYGADKAVRAVVTLESDVKVTSAGTNSWTLSK